MPDYEPIVFQVEPREARHGLEPGKWYWFRYAPDGDMEADPAGPYDSEADARSAAAR